MPTAMSGSLRLLPLVLWVALFPLCMVFQQAGADCPCDFKGCGPQSNCASAADCKCDAIGVCNADGCTSACINAVDCCYGCKCVDGQCSGQPGSPLMLHSKSSLDSSSSSSPSASVVENGSGTAVEALDGGWESLLMANETMWAEALTTYYKREREHRRREGILHAQMHGSTDSSLVLPARFGCDFVSEHGLAYSAAFNFADGGEGSSDLHYYERADGAAVACEGGRCAARRPGLSARCFSAEANGALLPQHPLVPNQRERSGKPVEPKIIEVGGQDYRVYEGIWRSNDKPARVFVSAKDGLPARAVFPDSHVHFTNCELLPADGAPLVRPGELCPES